ncbi:MAG TPA: hypothetical protein VED59_03640, partial [Acidimicrobiales bacterium]|nr:hypothetical protein [Acidimicrobiales bacterium]
TRSCVGPLQRPPAQSGHARPATGYPRSGHGSRLPITCCRVYQRGQLLLVAWQNRSYRAQTTWDVVVAGTVVAPVDVVVVAPVVVVGPVVVVAGWVVVVGGAVVVVIGRVVVVTGRVVVVGAVVVVVVGEVVVVAAVSLTKLVTRTRRSWYSFAPRWPPGAPSKRPSWRRSC